MTSADTRSATAGEGRTGGARPAPRRQTRHFLYARGAMETSTAKTPRGAEACARGVPPGPRVGCPFLLLFYLLLPFLFLLFPLRPARPPSSSWTISRLLGNGARSLRCTAPGLHCAPVRLRGRPGQSQARAGGPVRSGRGRRGGPHPELQPDLDAL